MSFYLPPASLGFIPVNAVWTLSVTDTRCQPQNSSTSSRKWCDVAPMVTWMLLICCFPPQRSDCSNLEMLLSRLKHMTLLFCTQQPYNYTQTERDDILPSHSKGMQKVLFNVHDFHGQSQAPSISHLWPAQRQRMPSSNERAGCLTWPFHVPATYFIPAAAPCRGVPHSTHFIQHWAAAATVRRGWREFVKKSKLQPSVCAS